jgi:hypothetical protein
MEKQYWALCVFFAKICRCQHYTRLCWLLSLLLNTWYFFQITNSNSQDRF